MKKENLKIFILLMILIISLAIFFMTLNKKSENISESSTKGIKNHLLLDLYFRQTISEGIINNNIQLKLDNDSIIYSSGKRQRFNSSSAVLIYKYSAFSCGACVEFGLLKIKDSFSEEGVLEPVMIISDYPKMFQAKHEQFINLGKRNLGMPLEETSLPFYFILINDKVQDVFVPEKKFPDYTEIYLKAIKEKYFKKNSVR